MLSITVTVLLLSSSFGVASGDCGDASLPLTAPKGLLASPGPDETGVCAWRISVPKNLRIIFNFDSYLIATATRVQDPDCGEKTTRIELKDGPTALPWRVYCQYYIPEPIATANKSSLFVQLKLSQGDSKSYFSAQYSTLPFEQSIDLRQTSSAEISSPNFPGKYPRNSYFKWSVVAPSGFRIKIEFTKFDIWNNGIECSQDALKIRDGSSAQSDLLANLCGSQQQPIYTSGNSATLQFVSSVKHRSEQRQDNIGFKATISKEAKLYLIVVPCAVGVVLATFLVGAIVFLLRRRSSPGVTYPRMQMSRLNDDDHFSTTHTSDVEAPNEASLPVYRPTTQQIKKT